MMDVYFDLENTIVIHKQKPASEVIENGLKAIKRHCSIFFNFTKEEAKNEPAMHDVIRQFTDGVPNEIKFLDSVVPERPLKSNFHQHIDNKQSIFFISGEIQNGKGAGSLIICEIGEEEELFKRLMFYHNEYKWSKDLPIGEEIFNCWEKLAPFLLPLTDIVILDKFLFNVDIETILCNYEKLLTELHKNKNIKTNIVIVTLPDKIHPKYDPITKTKDLLEKVIGKKPNVTIITYRSKPKHDRTIISNYLRFKSGDSFNYFNSRNEKITEGSELDIKSLIDSEYLGLSQNLISELQVTIDELLRKNPDAIKGDKTSNFLKFSD